MPGIPKRLSVMLPVRDRFVLTQKCIESIRQNSKEFHIIDIYVFDNKSDLEPGRFEYFQKLLQENQICYYSYDTNTSCHNCFGKAVTFRRWVNMMEEEYEVRRMMVDSTLKNCEQYYMLIDNDFIVGPDWGQSLISSVKQLKPKYPDLHYIVPFPGGTPERFRKDIPTIEINNLYNSDKLTVHFSTNGGSSGLWFTWYEGLVKLKWDYLSMCHTWGADKRHDSETWNYIKRINGNITYLACIESDKPVALHLGGVTGSLCNHLSKNTYQSNKEMIKHNEAKLFQTLSVKEIWEEYKNKNSRW